MLFVQAQKFYERFTGQRHEVAVWFHNRRVYEIRVDGEFYATAENKAQVFDEVVDIISLNNWTSINPI